MHRDRFHFDLVTQRFLKNRWDTALGQTAFSLIVDTLKRGDDIRSILDQYIFKHPDNQDPDGYPFYPKDAMANGAFWVLSHNDLRGIQVYNETFPDRAPFRNKTLGYARFFNCRLEGVNMERTQFTDTIFDRCHLESVSFANGWGSGTRFLNTSLKDACFWNTDFENVDLSGSDIRGIYLESATLENLTVNYATHMDEVLVSQWNAREMPGRDLPDHFKAFRIAFEKAELWQKVDKYLYLERKANRKYILKPTFNQSKTASNLYHWTSDLAWDVSTGYGTKPSKILTLGFMVSLVYAMIYFLAGNPGTVQDFAASLYFSFTTFATLGYGDLSYTKARWLMRLISTSEAWLGAILIATYVAVLGRKVIRH